MKKEVIERIINAVDIVDIISRDIQLEQVGNKYRGKCPFHEETVSSFYVYQSSQRFYCFGCHKKGNVIDYLRQAKGLSFYDALRYLDPTFYFEKRVLSVNTKKIEGLIRDLQNKIDRMHPSTIKDLVKEIDKIKIYNEQDLEIIAPLYHLRTKILLFIGQEG